MCSILLTKRTKTEYTVPVTVVSNPRSFPGLKIVSVCSIEIFECSSYNFEITFTFNLTINEGDFNVCCFVEEHAVINFL